MPSSLLNTTQRYNAIIPANQREAAKFWLAALTTNHNIPCITTTAEDEKYSACIILIQVGILIIFFSKHILPIQNDINLNNYY